MALAINPNPYVRDKRSTTKIMIQLLVGLILVWFAGVIYYFVKGTVGDGLLAFANVVVCVLTAVVTEFLFILPRWKKEAKRRGFDSNGKTKSFTVETKDANGRTVRKNITLEKYNNTSKKKLPQELRDMNGNILKNKKGEKLQPEYYKFKADPTGTFDITDSERIIIELNTGNAYFTPDHYAEVFIKIVDLVSLWDVL